MCRVYKHDLQCGLQPLKTTYRLQTQSYEKQQTQHETQRTCLKYSNVNKIKTERLTLHFREALALARS